MRYFGLFIVVTLNISLVLSNIRLVALHRMDIRHQLLSYVLLAILDGLFLFPTILEADCVVYSEEALVIKMLLWQARLTWAEIISCEKPAWLIYAIVKTRRCCYLINKRDIPEFAELLELIQLKLQEIRQCAPG